MDDIEELISRYMSGPGELTAAIDGLHEDQLNAVPVPGKWSIRQVICHITDFEIVSADRVKRILAEDNPTLADGDPDLFAAALCYDARDIREELELIALLRKSTGRILSACNVENYLRTGVHSKEGPMTLETIVERATHHIPHHIAFIEEKRQALRST